MPAPWLRKCWQLPAASASFRGWGVPEVCDQRIRERLAYSYRLVYRVEAERILVVAVMHGRRLLEGYLDQMD